MERREANIAGGRKLRELRLRAGLGVRELERLRHAVVAKHKSKDFFISHIWISDIEKGAFRPSIFKMYTLSVIYQCKPEEIIAHFGLDLTPVARDQALFGLPKTRLVRPGCWMVEQKVTLPMRLRPNAMLESTNLLNRLVEMWETFPSTRLLSSRGLLAAILSLFPRPLQLPIEEFLPEHFPVCIWSRKEGYNSKAFPRQTPKRRSKTRRNVELFRLFDSENRASPKTKRYTVDLWSSCRGTRGLVLQRLISNPGMVQRGSSDDH